MWYNNSEIMVVFHPKKVAFMCVSTIYPCTVAMFVEITWLIAQYIESLLVGTEAGKLKLVGKRVSVQPLNPHFTLK